MTPRWGRDDADSAVTASLSGLPRSLSWSAAASLASGLGALGFLTVSRFAVGLSEFAPMAHVWTVWSISAATVGFGAQIETIEALGAGRGVLTRRHLRLASGAALVVAILAGLWREVLFGSASMFWPLVCAVIPIGSLTTGIARGRLAAEGRQRRLAFVIAGENVVRLAGAGVILFLGGSARSLAFVLLAGFLVAIGGLSKMDLARVRTDDAAVSSGGAGAFAGLVAHASLVLPPSVLALRGEGPEVVAAVFLILTYVRAPYQFLLGMGPVLTAQSFSDRPARWDAWLSDGRRTTIAALIVMPGAAVLGLFGRDLISSLLLGGTSVVRRLDYAVLCSLVATVGLALVRSLYVLARGGRSVVVRAWGTTALVGLGSAFLPGDPTALFAWLLVGVVICLLQLNGYDPRQPPSLSA